MVTVVMVMVMVVIGDDSDGDSDDSDDDDGNVNGSNEDDGDVNCDGDGSDTVILIVYHDHFSPLHHFLMDGFYQLFSSDASPNPCLAASGGKMRTEESHPLHPRQFPVAPSNKLPARSYFEQGPQSSHSSHLKYWCHFSKCALVKVQLSSKALSQEFGDRTRH